MLPYCNISKQNYSNIIKNTKIEIQLPIKKYEVKDYLHIDMDDCFEYLTNEQGIIEKYCIRIFSLYTHKINIYKNRNQLQNKIWAYMIFKPSDNITQDKVYEFIYTTTINHYNIKINHFNDIYWENNNIIIGGDGALWVMFSNLCNLEPVKSPEIITPLLLFSGKCLARALIVLSLTDLGYPAWIYAVAKKLISSLLFIVLVKFELTL